LKAKGMVQGAAKIELHESSFWIYSFGWLSAFWQQKQFPEAKPNTALISHLPDINLQNS